MAHGDALEGKWRGKLENTVGRQYSSHYLVTWCIRHYYRWCAHLGCAVVDWTGAPHRADLNGLGPFRAKDEIWFLRVCHHVSNAVYCMWNTLPALTLTTPRFSHIALTRSLWCSRHTPVVSLTRLTSWTPCVFCDVSISIFNPLTPNDHYSSRTAPLTSKRCILYIYPTNIGTEYFKHGIYSPFFFSSSKCSLFHNSNVFGSCIIRVLYTECAKIKKKNNSGAKRFNTTSESQRLPYCKHVQITFLFR